MRALIPVLTVLASLSALTLTKSVRADDVFINSFLGDVSVVASEETNELETGRSLKTGDKVTSAEKSLVELYLPKSGLIVLHNQTEVAVVKSEKQSPTTLNLISGKIRMIGWGGMSVVVNVGEYSVSAAQVRLLLSPKGAIVLEGEAQVGLSNGSNATQVYPGEQVAFNGGLKKGLVDFDRLAELDNIFDFLPKDSQTPYVATTQFWAAAVARALKYHRPHGWETFSSQLFIDLFSDVTSIEYFPSDYFDTSGLGKAETDHDATGRTVVVARGAPVTMHYHVAVAKKGSYSVEVSSAGGSQYWSFEGIPTLLSPASIALTRKSVGPVTLIPGIYQLSVSVPEGGKLSQFSFSGPKQRSYVKSGHWLKDKVMTYEDMIFFIDGFLKEREKIASNYNSFFNSIAFSFWQRFLGVAWAENQNVGALFDVLSKKGFLLGEPSAPVSGSHAVTNAALLRPKEKVLPEGTLKKRKPIDPELQPDAFRSNVSPVIPSPIPLKEE